MKVVFSERAYASVMAETAEKIRTETGGLFLGAYENDVWYIVEAIDPGPKSVFEVAYFEYDKAYTQHLIRKIANLYEVELRLIGLWHRHPGSFNLFSSTDDGTNAKYAKLNPAGAISALVNIDPDFRITMYHVGRPARYTEIPYEVGDSLIPDRLMRFKAPDRFRALMSGLMQNLEEPKHEEHHKSVSFSFFLKSILPYLEKYLYEGAICEPEMDDNTARMRIIDGLLDDISYLSCDIGIELTVLQREKHVILVQESADGITRLYFAYSQKEDSIIFEYDGRSFTYTDGLFKALFETALAGININEKETADNTPADSTAADKQGKLNIFKLVFNKKNGGGNNGQH